MSTPTIDAAIVQTPDASITSPQDKLSAAIQALDAGFRLDIQMQLASLSPAEIADLLESTPPRLRLVILELVQNEEEFSHILSQLDTDIRTDMLQNMDISDLTTVGHDLDTDDFVDILQELPDATSNQVLASLDTRDRARVEKMLSYPNDTAGGIMNTDTITVRPHHQLKLILRYLRRYDKLPEMTDSLIVVNNNDQYIGLLPIDQLLVNNPDTLVSDIMETKQTTIECLLPQREVAQIFTRDDLISAPVVDENGRLIGRITVDDVVDTIIEDADQSLIGLSGIDVEQDTFAPIFKTVRSRGLWLGVNLLTACLAAAVISLFQESIVQVVSLAVLLPVVASMGGVAGTQTLTLVVRGMALNHVIPANLRWVIGRELLIGLLNGVMWATIIAVTVGLLFQNVAFGVMTGTAILITLLMAALAGVTLPHLLHKMNIDPAIAGSVILTTVTDVTGFLSFLGLATFLFF